jgi:hypothetical protein
LFCAIDLVLSGKAAKQSKVIQPPLQAGNGPVISADDLTIQPPKSVSWRIILSTEVVMVAVAESAPQLAAIKLAATVISLILTIAYFSLSFYALVN